MLKVVHNDIKYLLRCTGNMASFGGTRFGAGSNFHFQITPDIIEWMEDEMSSKPSNIVVDGFEYDLSIHFTKTDKAGKYVPKILNIRLDKKNDQVRSDNVRNRETIDSNITIIIPDIIGSLKDINLVGIERGYGNCLAIKQIILNGERYIPGNGINEQREYCQLSDLTPA
jgi:hypothetical protein